MTDKLMRCPDCGSTNFTGSHGCNPIDVAYYRYAKLRAKYEKAVAFIKQISATKYSEYSPPECSTYCEHIDDARELLKELNENA